MLYLYHFITPLPPPPSFSHKPRAHWKQPTFIKWLFDSFSCGRLKILSFRCHHHTVNALRRVRLLLGFYYIFGRYFVMLSCVEHAIFWLLLLLLCFRTQSYVWNWGNENSYARGNGSIHIFTHKAHTCELFVRFFFSLWVAWTDVRVALSGKGKMCIFFNGIHVVVHLYFAINLGIFKRKRAGCEWNLFMCTLRTHKRVVFAIHNTHKWKL